MSFPFKIPFAASGDQSTVPDSDLTGSVNFTDGYTPDYQADPSLDPNAKLIERDKFNFLMNKTTGAIGEIQRQGSADWYADLAPYDLNAEVFYNGKRWRSTIANNTATPDTGSEWLDVTPGTAAAKDVATLAQALAGTQDVLLDAAGGHAAFQQSGWWKTPSEGVTNKSFNDLSKRSGVYRFTSSDAGVPAFGSAFGYYFENLVILAGGLPYGGQVAFSYSGGEMAVRAINGGPSSPWRYIYDTGNFQPDISNGLKSPRLMRNVSGSSVNNEGGLAGSGLRFCDFSTTGVLTESATAATGTWRNISGTALAANEYGLFVRIA